MEVLKDLLGQPRSRVELVKALTAPITAKWHYPGGTFRPGSNLRGSPNLPDSTWPCMLFDKPWRMKPNSSNARAARTAPPSG